MGNLSYLLTIEKKDEFNSSDIGELLKKNFPKLKINISNNQIDIETLKGQVITHIYFDENLNDWADIDEDIDALKEISDEYQDKKYSELSLELEKLKNNNGYNNPTLAMTYSFGRTQKIRNNILEFLLYYFNGYWFDDGIHPEFSTSKTHKEDKKRVKKFKNFFKN